jgi:MFS family permease
MALTGRGLVAAMCVGQVGNLLPHVVVPAVMAQHLMPAWDLSGGAAGLMASAYAFGYMLAVPILTTLTDRVDAKWVLLAGSALSGLATMCFGLFAQGWLSAMALWGLAGIGFAGAYMPGLKALTDRLGAGDLSRSVTLYTSSYSFGVGLSFLVSQLVADNIGWRAAFLVTGLGPLLMIAAGLGLAAAPPPARSTQSRLLDFRPVIRNRPAMGYILGYGAHCYELYAMRTWLVPFWTFVMAKNDGHAPVSAVTLSVMAMLLAVPASILGNEAAIRFGRHRAILTVMILSAIVACVIGFCAGASPSLLLGLLVIYSILIPADSGALTSGMTTSAHTTNRGATMALHSTAGFGLSALGAAAVGFALDGAGGPATTSGWLAGFLIMTAGTIVGPIALLLSAKPTHGSPPRSV